MLTKAQIIWSLIGLTTGTTAYQAYEHRRELIEAAEGELPIAVADSLAELAPPDPAYASPDFKPEDTAGLTGKLAGYIDSARGSLARQNAEVCEGYCEVKRDKCLKHAGNERDLGQICRDEHEVCFAGCHADEKTQ